MVEQRTLNPQVLGSNPRRGSFCLIAWEKAYESCEVALEKPRLSSREIRSGRAQNFLEKEHVTQIHQWYRDFKDVENHVKVATLADLAENDPTSIFRSTSRKSSKTTSQLLKKPSRISRSPGKNARKQTLTSSPSSMNLAYRFNPAS